jgi:hypothetical protein
MTLNNEYILQNVVYGQASGNYDGSSQDFYSDPVRAANYYGGQGSIQTINLRTNNFVGNITFQATLNDQPSIQAAWFEISAYSSPVATNDIWVNTVTGNFTFIRARVTDFDSGTIESAVLTY